jgi:hypothetical protein
MRRLPDDDVLGTRIPYSDMILLEGDWALEKYGPVAGLPCFGIRHKHTVDGQVVWHMALSGAPYTSVPGEARYCSKCSQPAPPAVCGYYALVSNTREAMV